MSKKKDRTAVRGDYLEKKQLKAISRRKITPRLLWRQKYLLMMSIPFIVWLIIFKFIPLWGWTMAFQNVKPATAGLSWWERDWIGFDNFTKAFKDRLFNQVVINTICISLIDIAWGTICAITFAVLLNEIRFLKFKKGVQTISYLPHFVSWVIISALAKNVLNDGGTLDTLFKTNLKLMSTNSPLIWIVIVFISTWKEMGWSAIIYLSAMTGIDPGLYEAAAIDGANRAQRVFHITIPSISNTIIVLLIMSIGGVMGVGMERQMLLSNPLVQDHTMVLSWFSYTRGIGNSDYGLGTAIGVFQSMVGVILMLIANQIAKAFGQYTLI